MSRLKLRLSAAGYGHLWDNFSLGFQGIRTLHCPEKLLVPTVLSPESAEPLPGKVAHVRLTPGQCREILWLMFGDDPGIEASV